MRPDKETVADRGLRDRCVAGDEAAWRELRARHHAALLDHVRRRLRERGLTSKALADELVQNVWEALVLPDRRGLRAFDPSRGSWLDYLRAVADGELHGYLRSECRRRTRSAAARPEVRSTPGPENDAELGIRELLERLPPRLREQLLCLIGERADDASPLSPAARWQATRRLRLRIQLYTRGRGVNCLLRGEPEIILDVSLRRAAAYSSRVPASQTVRL